MSPLREKTLPSHAHVAIGQGARGLLLVLVLILTMGASVADLNEAGKAAYARGDFAEAERLFSQAIAQAPEEPVLHYHRAVALMRLHRWREAAEAHRAVLRLAPPPALAAAAQESLRTLEPLTRPPPRSAPEPAEASIPLQRARGGWFTEVMLNSTETARFLVDTGASVCVISPELAGILGVRPRRRTPSVTLETLAGQTEATPVTIRSIRVGEVEAEDVPAVVHVTAAGIDGILGNTFLSRYQVTLDPEQGVLRLRQR